MTGVLGSIVVHELYLGAGSCQWVLTQGPPEASCWKPAVLTTLSFAEIRTNMNSNLQVQLLQLAIDKFVISLSRNSRGGGPPRHPWTSP